METFVSGTRREEDRCPCLTLSRAAPGCGARRTPRHRRARSIPGSTSARGPQSPPTRLFLAVYTQVREGRPLGSIIHAARLREEGEGETRLEEIYSLGASGGHSHTRQQPRDNSVSHGVSHSIPFQHLHGN